MLPLQKFNWRKKMFKSELKEMIRLSYLAGIDDKNNDCDQWCVQGSNERAEELIQEFEDNGELTATLCLVT